MSDDDDLVTAFVEVLSEIVDVTFYTSEIRVEEIRDEADFHPGRGCTEI